jgi:hypothetical protein
MSGRREVAVGLGAYACYLVVRQRVWNDAGRARALRNARRVAAFEHRGGVDFEPRVQELALRWPRVVDVLSACYAVGNVGLSVGWLLLLFARRDRAFLTERRAAVTAFAGALPFFALVPTAPPRMLDGYVDTMATRGRGLDHPLLVRCYNPIAALPSHHVAFAVVSGAGLAKRSSGRARRAWWRSYPAGVALVVVATGNHFVVDVAAGSVLGAVARRIARPST